MSFGSETKEIIGYFDFREPTSAYQFDIKRYNERKILPGQSEAIIGDERAKKFNSRALSALDIWCGEHGYCMLDSLEDQSLSNTDVHMAAVDEGYRRVVEIKSTYYEGGRGLSASNSSGRTGDLMDVSVAFDRGVSEREQRHLLDWFRDLGFD